jgi:hypothetical protein
MKSIEERKAEVQAVHEEAELFASELDAKRLRNAMLYAKTGQHGGDNFMEDSFQTVGEPSTRQGLIQRRNAAFSHTDQNTRRDGDCEPVYTCEADLEEIRQVARVILALNPTAQCIQENLTNYTVGFKYTVSAKNHFCPPGLVDAVQAVIDEFIRVKRFDELEVELFQRSERDGEYFVEFEDCGYGQTDIAIREPVSITQPQDPFELSRRLRTKYDSWKYGVHADVEDTSKVFGYWVTKQVDNVTRKGEYIPIEDLQHVKINVDRNCKRGISSYFSVANDIEETRKLIRNLRLGGGLQSAVAWVREHAPGVTKTGAEGMAAAAASGSFDILTQGVSSASASRQQPVSHYAAPVILDVKSGQKYQGGPLAGAGTSPLLALVDLCLRSIGTRWNLTPDMVGASTSGDSFASALAAEGKTTKSFERKQRFYKSRFIEILDKVVVNAANYGRFSRYRVGASVLALIEITAEGTPIVARDRKMEAEIADKMLGHKIASRRTVAQKLGYDYDTEIDNREADGDDLQTVEPTDAPISVSPIDPLKSEVEAERRELQGPQPTAL